MSGITASTQSGMTSPGINAYQSNDPTQKVSFQRYSKLNIFSTKRRIGRFAYFFYSLMVPFLFFWVMAALAGVAGKFGAVGSMAAYLLLAIGIVSALVVLIQLTIQRCHDINVSGWFSLLIVIPLAFLLFWLIPGSRGLNKYGDAAKPASTLLKMGATLLIAALVATLTYMAFQYFGINLG
ncbi:MAG TPA: DUF805 domain-containing protein [Leucothrix mucor]|nr:DUF805 domain-containing protein [Leucothrix mucor]